MGFFDETIDEDWLKTSAEESVPAWTAPPTDVVPAVIAVQVPLVQTSDLAMWLAGASVFGSGVAYTLNIRWHPGRSVSPPFIPGRGGRDGLCLAIETDDGARALARRGLPRGRTVEPAPPLLTALGAHHGPGFATVDLWMWPLLEVGVEWIVEWRAERISETRKAQALAPIASVAHLAARLWPLGV
jgi:hypothetical protein